MLIKRSEMGDDARKLDLEFMRGIPNIESAALLPAVDPENPDVRKWIVTYFQRTAVTWAGSTRKRDS